MEKCVWCGDGEMVETHGTFKYRRPAWDHTMKETDVPGATWLVCSACGFWEIPEELNKRLDLALGRGYCGTKEPVNIVHGTPFPQGDRGRQVDCDVRLQPDR